MNQIDMKDLRYRLEYSALATITGVMRRLPRSWMYGFVRVFSRFVFSVLRMRRDVVLDNLSHAFPEKSREELMRIARETYYNIGITFFEMMIVPDIADGIAEMFENTLEEHIRDEINSPSGVIAVSAHMGSWEMMGAALSAFGVDLYPAAKRQANPYVDQYINWRRQLLGMHIVHTGASVKGLVRMLKEHKTIVLISDQDASRHGVFVDFFGRPASTPVGAASLALKFGCPLIVTFAIRLAPGRYRFYADIVGRYPDDTVESLTARYTKIIEQAVRAFPEQYFWMHRRWKRRPAGEGEPEPDNDGGGR